MDAQILSPILDVLLRNGCVRVSVNPPSNVFGEPLVKFVEILRNNKSNMPNVVPVHEQEGIAGVALSGKRAVLWDNCGLHCRKFHRRYRVTAVDLSSLFPRPEACRAARTLSFSSLW